MKENQPIAQIQELPELREEIQDLIINQELVIFIGAGVSRLLGCKSWKDLAYDLIDKCFELHLINYQEAQRIKSNAGTDSKRLISIAYELMKAGKKISKFYQILNLALKGDKEKIKKRNIYELLRSLSEKFVTTNADKLFDKLFDAQNIVFDFNKDVKVQTNKLYKIHGTTDIKETLVFCANSYLNRYNSESFRQFLKRIFQDHTVLFVGYSLSEFELLDYIILKGTNENSKKEPRHYALMPYYPNEASIYKYDSLYYKQLNINVIPYAIHKKGYDQLYDVIHTWKNKSLNFLQDAFKELDLILNKKAISKQNIKTVVSKIRKNKVMLKHFIFYCSKRIDLTERFIIPLYNAGFFNPKENPKAEQSEFHKGCFRIPRWPILDFLNLYIEYIKKGEKTFCDEYIKIINENTDLSCLCNDNDRTYSSFITYIFELPPDKIKKRHIDFLRKALSSQWGALLSSNSIRQIDYEKIFKLKPEIRKDFWKVIFDVRQDENNNQLLDPFCFEDIIKKNFAKIYNVLDVKLIKIVIEVLQNFSKDDFIFIRYEANNGNIPHISKYYPQTLVNILMWYGRKDIKQLKKYESDLKKCGIFNHIIKALKNKDLQEYSENTYENEYLPIDSYIELDIKHLLDIIQKEKILDSDIYELFKKYPNKYVNNLNEFKGIEYKYILKIIDAYSLLLNERQFITTKPVVDFLIQLSASDKLFANKTNNNYFISIGKYLIEYLKYLNNESSQSIYNYDAIEKLVFKILHNLSPDRKDYFHKDYISVLLNSESGIAVLLLIELYLFTHGNHKFQNKIEKIKKTITDLLKHKILIHDKNCLMIFAGCGFLFEELYTCDKKFANEIIKIVDNSKTEDIKAFCKCYFHKSKYSPQKSFELIRSCNFLNNLIKSSVQYDGFGFLVCENFFKDSESIKSINDKKSPIHKLVHAKNKFYLLEAVDHICYAYANNKSLDNKEYKKIINLYNEICKELKKKQSELNSYQDLIIKLLYLVSVLKSLNSTITKNIIFLIETLQQYHIDINQVPILLPTFNDLYKKESNRNNIQKIMMAFCNHNIYFDNFDSNVYNLLKAIIEEDNDIGKELINKYILHRNANYESLLKKYK